MLCLILHLSNGALAIDIGNKDVNLTMQVNAGIERGGGASSLAYHKNEALHIHVYSSDLLCKR